MTTQDQSADQLTASLIAMYVIAEQELLSGATTVLRRTAPTLEGRQGMVPKLRLLVRRILARLAGSTSLADAMISAATIEGRQAAHVAASTTLVRRSSASQGGGGGRVPPGRSLASGSDGFFDLSMPHGERAAQAIRDDVVSELEDVRRRITRLPDDIYKAIAPHGAIYQVVDNGVTPAQAQAMAWRVFASQGVTGFTDKSGRDWSMSAYVEMAVRTASVRAFNSSHLDRMLALGIEYFTVPVTAHTCPQCFPWQGKVLTAVPVENPAVPVSGTIADAVAAGLWHPNCRHPLTAFFPGVTVLPEIRTWTPEDQRLYELTQRQRRLELEVRKAKRQLEYAASPETAADARARVRRAQAKVREFVQETGFSRQSRREQVDLSDPRIKLTIPR
ncbi:phage minor capsid protein [Microbacterium sp. MYb64]|uniref:phage minor capsid protein n=1 Tax=Microbacterium sp. MYb64 TaxID=1848691 RepID=UPI000CFC0789|nr:phage minor capsid protein [Microbacterium sp. MYb64]PRB01761.1 hypothetical protein CQ044_16565 [Microbacterium sp. MYb64]